MQSVCISSGPLFKNMLLDVNSSTISGLSSFYFSYMHCLGSNIMGNENAVKLKTFISENQRVSR